jgi:Protein of unknown function, DUF547
MRKTMKIGMLIVLALGPAALPSSAAGFDQTHQLFDDMLHHYVKDARVDYTGLKANTHELNRYLAHVAAVTKSDFKQWNENEQIAFLINAYNAYTLRLILDHYPVKSIKDIGSLLTGPWDQPVVNLFGQTLTLNAVEHGILRKDYTEPRIHFALVCAAKGCPPLRNEAYVGTRLNEQLDDQARRFLANPQKNRVDVENQTVYLSPIFKWYGADFQKKSGGVLQFLMQYWPETERTELEKGGFKIRYTDYVWSLNDSSWK